MDRRNAGTLVAGLATFALVACSSPVEETTTPSSPVPIEETTPPSEPAPIEETTPPSEPAPVEVQPDLVDEFSDDDGYAYRFELDDFTIDVTEDVANAKPGEVHLFVTYTASGRLLNRTPQRNANVPEIDYGVIWLANSPFCKGSTGAVAPAFYGDPEAEEAYCKISNAAGFPVGEPLQVGEERVLPLKGGNIPPIVVAESDVSNVKASLLDPYAQVVGRRNYGTWNPEPFDCGMKNNQGYLTAASAEIVGCSRFT